MSPKSQPDVVVRTATAEDSAICGRICYDAFSSINGAHHFPCDFPAPEAAIGALSAMFSHSGFYCVVAEIDGRIVGSNCLDERSVIAGVGPITVDPGTQNSGIGRKLMEAVMDRASERHAAGVRLVQAAFHNRSLSLYTSLGFDVREPLSCLQGRTLERSVPGCVVRRGSSAIWMPAMRFRCGCMDSIVGPNWRKPSSRGAAAVVERGGRITGYATALAFSGHATAETNLELQALIASADSFGGPGIRCRRATARCCAGAWRTVCG